MKKHLCLLFLLLLAGTRANADAPPRIVASFGLLADMAQAIAPKGAIIETLVPTGQDPHDYQPRPEDAQKLARANVILINGLGFEGWLGRLINASGSKAKLLVASAGVVPRVMGEDAQGRPIVDPHAWQDPRNAKIYIRNIAPVLAAAYPDKATDIAQAAAAYAAKIEALDTAARKDFAAIPQEKRKMITSHDAFGYLAAAYGLTILSPVGINDEVEPTATDVAKLIDQMKRERIRALFVENLADPRLARQIAEETGVTIGGTLYADTLSPPEGEAATYLDLMTSNLRKISQALRGH